MHIDEHIESVATAINSQEDTQVLRHLKSLHGPLYLPLNRRWIEAPEGELAPFYRRRYRYPTIDAFTPTPIWEVLSRAERTFRQDKSNISDLQEELISWITKDDLDEKRISELQVRVEDYEATLEKIKARSENFLRSVNNFFNDNNKTLMISQELELAV